MTSSIGDVADRAGVSVATVSRALRGLPNVAEATRLKVLQAAAELDYVVNPNASRLAAGRNHTIGVVCPDTMGLYFQNVVSGVQTVLAAREHDMLLYTLPNPEARDRFLRELPFRKRVDGLVLVDIPLTDPEQRMLAGLGTPLVSVGEGGAHFPLVRVDNARGARLATDYLLDLGHRRIGLLSGPLSDVMQFRAAHDRRDGWVVALKERGLDPTDCMVATADFSMGEGAAGMSQLLSQVPGLTGVVCVSDEVAIGALHLLREQRIRVPEDISVVGFDDQEVSEYIGLSTVRQPMARLGVHAAEILFALLRGEPLGSFPAVLPVSLVPRDTTAPYGPDGRTVRSAVEDG